MLIVHMPSLMARWPCLCPRYPVALTPYSWTRHLPSSQCRGRNLKSVRLSVNSSCNWCRDLTRNTVPFARCNGNVIYGIGITGAFELAQLHPWFTPNLHSRLTPIYILQSTPLVGLTLFPTPTYLSCSLAASANPHWRSLVCFPTGSLRWPK